MSGPQTLQTLKRFLNYVRMRFLLRIHSAQQIRGIIERERSRSDRFSSEFSLVMFDLDIENGHYLYIWHLVQTLHSRIRCYDDIGWFDGWHIGVVLPNTSYREAVSFAEEISRKINKYDISYLRYEIYTYPGHWINKHHLVTKYPAPMDKTFEKRSSFIQIDADSSHVPRFVESATIAFAEATVLPNQMLLQPIPIWKRCMDILVALTLLILFSPVMIGAAVLIKLTSKGPIFYVQKRTGYNLKRFNFYKFRSMYMGADLLVKDLEAVNEWNGKAPLVLIKNDPRITPVGKWLRKTSVDELPQLFNVLKGDLSLIGPRAQSAYPSQYDLWQLRRYSVRPGVACRWQAERRGETDFVAWMRSDLRYTRKISLRADLKLFYHILVKVLSCKGSC
ncbi:MAG: sugar transferase [bacterium]